jgi:hypothetical protein
MKLIHYLLYLIIIHVKTETFHCSFEISFEAFFPILILKAVRNGDISYYYCLLQLSICACFMTALRI